MPFSVGHMYVSSTEEKMDFCDAIKTYLNSLENWINSKYS